MDFFKITALFAKSRLKSSVPASNNNLEINRISLLPAKSNSAIIYQEGDSYYRNTQRLRRQISSLLPVYLLQLCYGMNSGFPAILTPQLSEPCSEFSVSTIQESWIVCLDNLLAPLICITSGFFQQKFGPLKMLMFCCLPYSIGWMIAAMANDAYHLYISRILVSISHAFISTTVYTVEISIKEFRGSLSVLESVIRCIGSVLIYSLGLHFRWWEIASFASMVPIVAFIACMFAPESPVFLVKEKCREEAEISVKRAFGDAYDAETEVRIISENIRELKESKKRKSDYIRNIRSHPEIYKPFFIIIFLSLVQQFSGVSVIRAYVVKIFDEVFQNISVTHKNPNSTIFSTECDSESQTSSMAYMSAILIGVCRLVSSLTLARLLKNFSRRIMYFSSISLTIFCLFAFSSFSYMIEMSDSSSFMNISMLKWASLTSACLLVFSVQLGVQTLPLLLSGELFPADVRASCKGLTRAITYIFLVLMVKSFPELEKNLYLYGTFFTFSIMMLFFLPVVYFILPETKDISLEMIQEYFRPSNAVLYTENAL